MSALNLSVTYVGSFSFWVCGARASSEGQTKTLAKRPGNAASCLTRNLKEKLGVDKTPGDAPGFPCIWSVGRCSFTQLKVLHDFKICANRQSTNDMSH